MTDEEKSIQRFENMSPELRAELPTFTYGASFLKLAVYKLMKKTIK